MVSVKLPKKARGTLRSSSKRPEVEVLRRRPLRPEGASVGESPERSMRDRGARIES